MTRTLFSCSHLRLPKLQGDIRWRLFLKTAVAFKGLIVALKKNKSITQEERGQYVQSIALQLLIFPLRVFSFLKSWKLAIISIHVVHPQNSDLQWKLQEGSVSYLS